MPFLPVNCSATKNGWLKNRSIFLARLTMSLSSENAGVFPSACSTTNLLIDLKKRQLLHEDKLNYELNIGARRFKCTTIPILRKDFGIVGAICINIDANYLTDEVMQSKEQIEAWFKNFCRTDMQADENILSKDEYAKAIDQAVFPGQQGGPLMHVIAAKAVAFKEALEPEFTAYQQQIVANAKALSARLEKLPAAGGDELSQSDRASCWSSHQLRSPLSCR